MFAFPLPASARYSYRRRFGAEHKGIDIMAPRGTPVLAVEAGTAWATTDPKGGNVVYLDSINTRRYYYAHLDRWAAILLGKSPHVDVRVGDVLGYVGNTGNAAGKPPHLHLQIRVRDTDTYIDPFDQLRELDPNRDRSSVATPAPTKRGGGPTWVLVLGALIWMYARGQR
jgi:murein DD-endopeptidase MepM/ murein hydrolase activator NlpD